MSQDSPATQPVANESTWREIEEVVQEVTRQSRADVPADHFFKGLLENSVRTLAATGGAVWLRQPEGLRLEHQVNLVRTGLVTGPEAEDVSNVEQRSQQHMRLLERISRQTRAHAVSPQSGAAAEATSASLPDNPTDFLLLFCPFSVDDQIPGVLEIFQRPDASPGAVQGFLRFLSALAELTADYLRNSQLRDLQDRATLWSQFEKFTERVHEGLDVEQIAAVIANDGRHLIGCDRVTVAVRKGTQFQIRAVSGMDSIDHRSNVLRAARSLIRQVNATGEPFWYQDSVDEDQSQPQIRIAPQLEDSVHRYLDEAPARLMGVFPLMPVSALSDLTASSNGTVSCDTTPVGAILIERFEGATNTNLIRYRSEVVARQSASALHNALEYSSLPFVSLLRLVGRAAWYFRLRQLPRTALFAGALAVAVLALILVPADFTVEGSGELQPAVRRGVFASSDGVVASLAPVLSTSDAASVTTGETLIDLSNTDLDFELTRVLGEIRTAQESLRTKEVERVNIDESDPDWESILEKLSAEEKELEVRKSSLEAQLNVLRMQQQDLILSSPIDGQILTWEAARILENRPVRRGDLLVEIADVDGPWVLEIQVPDQDIGYVNTARRELKSELDVSFILATDPRTMRYGTVRDVASDTRSNRESGPTVLVTVEINRDDIPENQLRPGATVIPHIHAGQRSVGFVWFHKLIHMIRTKVLF